MEQQTNSNARRAAFTIVEVIVVVVILAIACLAIVPLVGDTSDFQALSAARMMTGDLEYARDTAITGGSAITVTFDVDGDQYTVSNASGTLIHPMTKSDYVVDFGSQDGFGQLDIVSASFGGQASVTFDVTGAPTQEGTVTVQAGSHQYQVRVYGATGRVKATRIGG